MKVCLAFYPIDDMGGIINHNEQLCAGLQELGHEVHTRVFLPRDDIPRNGLAGGRGTISPYTNLEFDQRRGYSWPRRACLPYRGDAKKGAIEALNGFDLVIWQVAVPTKRAENRGNIDWIDLYHETTAKQIAVIHDGNFLASYPWLSVVADKLSGIACVHHCAFNSAKNLSVPSALIFNPQDVSQTPDISETAFSLRNKGFLSVQTFKAWKHVPELVTAIPYTRNIECHLAGKGIDYYYLTSEDKCKWPGVWDKALRAGMQYHDVITNERRDELLRQLTCLVDPSWSHKYAKIGGHFNRVMIDAILQGAVPIGRPLGLGMGAGGEGELFVKNENCLVIPTDVPAHEYGEWLTVHCNMSYAKYEALMTNALELLKYFDRKTVASEYVGLSTGDYVQYGSTTEEVVTASATAIVGFFNDKS